MQITTNQKKFSLFHSHLMKAVCEIVRRREEGEEVAKHLMEVSRLSIRVLLTWSA